MEGMAMKNRAINWFLLLTGIGGIIGVGAIVYRLVEGMKVTSLTSNFPWGMWISYYIYFIGLSAGSFLFSTLIYVFGRRELEKAGRLALFSAFFALVAGLLFIWMDLGHPWRFLYVLTHWNYSSVLAWEILFYLGYIVVVLAELWYLMRVDLALMRDESSAGKRVLYGILALGWKTPATEEARMRSRQGTMQAAAVLGAIGIPLAIGVHGGTGAVFAVVKARPHWYSAIFPIIFLTSALVSGAGLMTFLYAFLGDKGESDYPSIVRSLADWLILFLAIDIILIIAEFLVTVYGNIPEPIAIWKEMIFGPYWFVFWVGQIGLAMLVPILIYLVKRNSSTWLGIGGLSVVMGIVAVRLNLVIPAFATSPVPLLDKAFHDARFVFSYFPSLTEWVTSLGLISVVAFFFLLFYRLFPMVKTSEEYSV